MAVVRGVGGLGGTNSEYLGGSSPIQREFLFEGFVVGAFPQPLADSGGGVLDPKPIRQPRVGGGGGGHRRGRSCAHLPKRR